LFTHTISAGKLLSIIVIVSAATLYWSPISFVIAPTRFETVSPFLIFIWAVVINISVTLLIFVQDYILDSVKDAVAFVNTTVTAALWPSFCLKSNIE
jgi:hypothetical protein